MSLRKFLITGCTNGGLGAALGVSFCKSGCQVFATAPDVRLMTAVKSAGAHTLALDVTSDTSIKACLQEISALSSGSLDILVNNAGRNYGMPVVDINIAEMRNVLEVNLYPLISVTRAFLPLLQKAQYGNGLLVNNTSAQSVVLLPFDGAYNASKAAAAMLTSVLRLELEPFNIRVVDLKTTGVRTDIHKFKSSAVCRLPQESIYHFAREPLECLFRGKGKVESAISPEAWAATVVKSLLRKNPPEDIWAGGDATYIALSQWFPRWVIKSALRRITGLDAMQARVKN